MRRTIVFATALACATALSGCGFVIMRSAKYAYGEYTKEERAVDSALSKYQQFVLGMETDRIVDMFDTTSELSIEAQTPALGRDAIRSFLLSRADVKVVEYELTPSSTSVSGANGSQRGTYRQKLRTPEGQDSTARGRFEAQWVRQASGPWLIRRMHLVPEPEPGTTARQG
jgi:ketosteroid isomerase-like protein